MSEVERSLRSIRRMVTLIAIFAFMALVVMIFTVFGIQISKIKQGDDPSVVPSALIGQVAPTTDLPPLAGLGLPGVNSVAFKGQVTLVNIWASWCVPCRQEHPALMQLASNPRIRLVGVNYKDQPANALGFLNEMGNPYKAVGIDQRGRTAIDWGVYGVPETFLVGRDGTIRYKLVGPIGDDGLKSLSAEIDKALAAPG